MASNLFALAGVSLLALVGLHAAGFWYAPPERLLAGLVVLAGTAWFGGRALAAGEWSWALAFGGALALLAV
jgi:hypothetical protein